MLQNGKLIFWKVHGIPNLDQLVKEIIFQFIAFVENLDYF